MLRRTAPRKARKAVVMGVCEAPIARIRSRSGSIQWALDCFLLACRARDLSEDTLDFYRRKLAPFVAYLADRGVSRISLLNIQHVQGFMVLMRDLEQSASNIHAHARAIRAYLRWLHDSELIDSSLIRQFRMPVAPKPHREGFTEQEVAALLRAAKATAFPERDAALLALMADTAIRAGEVGRIRDVDWDFDRILIHGKGRRERVVPISDETRKLLSRWRRVRGDSEWLFVTARGDAMDRQTVYKIFRRLGEKLGICPCHPHMMRRATAVEWIRGGGDTFSLQSLLGHSSQTMSRLYVELADSDVRDKHAKLSLVARLHRRKR